MINLKKTLVAIFLFIFAVSYATAVSRQYSGGEVNIQVKDNQLCLYIDNKDLSGKYYIHLFKPNNMITIGSYSEDFSKNYPTKNQCIQLSALKPTQNLTENEPYLVVLEAGRFIFGKKFCVSYENRKIFVKDFNSNRCETIKPSFWKKIFNFF